MAAGETSASEAPAQGLHLPWCVLWCPLQQEAGTVGQTWARRSELGPDQGWLLLRQRGQQRRTKG